MSGSHRARRRPRARGGAFVPATGRRSSKARAERFEVLRHGVEGIVCVGDVTLTSGREPLEEIQTANHHGCRCSCRLFRSVRGGSATPYLSWAGHLPPQPPRVTRWHTNLVIQPPESTAYCGLWAERTNPYDAAVPDATPQRGGSRSRVPPVRPWPRGPARDRARAGRCRSCVRHHLRDRRHAEFVRTRSASPRRLMPPRPAASSSFPTGRISEARTACWWSCSALVALAGTGPRT